MEYDGFDDLDVVGDYFLGDRVIGGLLVLVVEMFVSLFDGGEGFG